MMRRAELLSTIRKILTEVRANGSNPDTILISRALYQRYDMPRRIGDLNVEMDPGIPGIDDIYLINKKTMSIDDKRRLYE